MKQRILLFNEDARNRLKKGMDELADMVKITLGPLGNNVIIEKSIGSPLITKDGVTVAKEVFLKDPICNIGAQLLKEVALKTNEMAGDGTTTATVLAQALLTEGIKSIIAGVNPIDLKKGMNIAVKEISRVLREISSPIKSKEDIIHIASISANNDEQTGRIIADAMESAGNEGTVIVEDANGVENSIEVAEGVQLDRGYTYSSFINKKQTMEVELQNCYILLYNSTLDQFNSMVNLMNQIVKQGDSSLIIIADEFSDELTKLLVLNNMRGTIKCCAIQSPGFGDRRVDLLNDIAIFTGGQVFGRDSFIDINNIQLSSLGKAKKVLVDKNKTVIVGGNGDTKAIKETVDQIKYLIANTTTAFDKQRLQERLGKLTGGIAILKVGAVTETELIEKKMRIEDALHATRAALEEGIVPGGGTALIRVRNLIMKDSVFSYLNCNKKYQEIGKDFVLKALEVPFLSICSNAGVSGEVVLNKIEETEDLKFGYDVLNEQYGNLFEMGVVDPTKVVRLALENAISIVGMFLTTKGVIVQSEEEKEYINNIISQNVPN
jgi:chaperonin GroEL